MDRVEEIRLEILALLVKLEATTAEGIEAMKRIIEECDPLILDYKDCEPKK